MNRKDFDNLSKSVVQAGKIRRGSMKASRTTTINPADVKAIRSRWGSHRVNSR